jgi:NAD(P)-dependent dehydrogenase (short-subunit alcohol dehydrogenase family)
VIRTRDPVAAGRIIAAMANQRILITGARRGIGAALAGGLAEPGRTLLIHHVGAAAEAERVAGACRDRGAAAEALEADLADPAAVGGLAERAGDVDVLINNAAHASNVGIGVLPLAEWQVTFAVNVTAPMLLAQALAPGMAARGWGRIVNVTSATVRLGGPSGPSYVSSKAALIGLTRSLAHAYGRDGITVNALSPGAVDTEGERELAGAGEIHRDIRARQAIPRGLVPDDLVGTVRYLVSDGAAAMTGQVLEVGAGLVLR